MAADPMSGAAMRLIMFCHPDFFASQSMPRFAGMLKSAYEDLGHRVEVWRPRARVFNWMPRGSLSKWGGYVDQYVLFPIWVRRALARTPQDTLFVFCDQALGPWVPLVRNRPHVVHVHDLLALRSALGCIPENPTSLTGRIYQRYIRRGFRRARHFISISEKTRDDLYRFGGVAAQTSEVVYNGMNFPYTRLTTEESLQALRAAGLPAPAAGVLLHVGGGQWYKNLTGVLALYAQYARRAADPLPLWCIGPKPDGASSAAARLPPAGRVHFFRNLPSATLQAAYSLGRSLIFPSLAEGFGWPLLEAQACGCPVITTDEPPMNEVAGPAARYLPRLKSSADLDEWSVHGAAVLQEMLDEDAPARERRMRTGQQWASRFGADRAIEGYLAVYARILESSQTHTGIEAALDHGTPS
jgi:glycosyltransferase involved in cell wall biosynthesis